MNNDIDDLIVVLVALMGGVLIGGVLIPQMAPQMFPPLSCIKDGTPSY